MPNQQDHDIIDGLFDRIENVARSSAPRDADAELQIQQRLREFPPAPYYLAQTVVMQEQALRQAEQRIAELEALRPRGPWDQRGAGRDQRAGQGGFLAGAAETALGVAGGMFLFNAIGGLFSGSAHAGEADVSNADIDAGGDDFGDGGFDIGGDF